MKIIWLRAQGLLTGGKTLGKNHMNSGSCKQISRRRGGLTYNNAGRTCIVGNLFCTGRAGATEMAFKDLSLEFFRFMTGDPIPNPRHSGTKARARLATTRRPGTAPLLLCIILVRRVPDHPFNAFEVKMFNCRSCRPDLILRHPSRLLLLSQDSQ